MKYSVLMSVYKNDSPDHLATALKSIYDDQTRKPDEVVVIFDGPLTSGLYDVLEEFRRGREDIVFYYPQEVNRGLGEALRIGVGKCTGDYIFRMDADDISAPERFRIMSEYVEAHPEIDVLGTDIAEFQNSPFEKDLRIRACPARHEDIVKRARRRSPMNHVSVCMKKSAVIGCGNYESVLLVEDYYIWLKLIASGYRLANINENLVYVRIGNGFDSKRGDRLRIEGWKKLQKYMRDNEMIGYADAVINMILIRGFVNTGGKLKSILYGSLFRKQLGTGTR